MAISPSKRTHDSALGVTTEHFAKSPPSNGLESAWNGVPGQVRLKILYSCAPQEVPLGCAPQEVPLGCAPQEVDRRKYPADTYFQSQRNYPGAALSELLGTSKKRQKTH
jgi:hypothetical protein